MAEKHSDIQTDNSDSPVLLLPTIIGVRRHPDDENTSSLNRLAIFLTSAVDMYASLSIKDYPLWGMYMMNNLTCATMLAFRSSDDDVSEHSFR